MSARIDGLISEWAEDVVNNCHKSGFSGINIIEKILRDPGISTSTSRHKVLWWPKNKRIAMMSRAMHRIDPISQVCLIVRYGRMLKDDSSIFQERDLVRNSSLTMREVRDRIHSAKKRLMEIVYNG